uniref:KASH domain containing 5 n=1 Tax=Canis lupus dingo TaxID=286419 RepID=A0A8C0R7J9_CANLU
MDVPEGQAGGPAAKMYLWDQLEEGSLGTLLSLEEQILNSMFEACDTQRTGIVAVTHVLAYLEAVTGRGPQDTRLRTLACNLDPNGEGPQATVDLDTFLAVMRDWIAACQLDGAGQSLYCFSFSRRASSPHCSHPLPRLGRWRVVACDQPFPDLRPATADLLSSLEDLELSNRRLAGENAKLQRSVETAEEGATRLGEEITALRRQLRSTQQALQCAKAVNEELEDLKTLAKNLEEQNRRLLAQARQTEKEQQHLVAEMETLQEENGKLLAERDGVKRRSEELATEKEALKVPPLPGGHFISFSPSEQRGRGPPLPPLQELRLEISHLEEKLSGQSKGAQVRRVGWTRLLPPSLGVEIEAIQQRNFQGEPAHPHGGRQEVPSLSPLSLQESLPIPLGDPHPGDIPGSPPESSPAEPELQQALVPVVKELVPVRRPVWGQVHGQLCLPTMYHQPLRVPRHPLIPVPVLGLLLLLLLSILLLGQSPPPTWPHLQLCYLQPPPV